MSHPTSGAAPGHRSTAHAGPAPLPRQSDVPPTTVVTDAGAEHRLGGVPVQPAALAACRRPAQLGQLGEYAPTDDA